MSTEFESVYSGYLWFDRILDIEKGKKARAVKSVSSTEKFFVDHFPKFPVVPGMLQLEGMIQLGSWLVSISNDFNCATIPQTIKGVDFRKYVRPGDQLILETEILSLETNNAIVKAKATVDGKIVANVKEIIFKYLPLAPDQVTEGKKRFYLLLGNL